MSRYLDRKIAAARVTQIDRVNNDPERLKERVDELTRQNEHLLEQLRAARRRIAELNERVDDLAGAGAADAAVDTPGRPTLNAREAAYRKHVGYHTVCRYLRQGHWQGYKDDFGHWHVYADQPMTIKTRKRK